jgi:hypothetical protein
MCMCSLLRNTSKYSSLGFPRNLFIECTTKLIIDVIGVLAPEDLYRL